MPNPEQSTHRIIATPEIARRLGLSVRSIQNLRWKRQTPDGWIALAPNLLGLPEDVVDAWVAARLLGSVDAIAEARDRMRHAREAKRAKNSTPTNDTAPAARKED